MDDRQIGSRLRIARKHEGVSAKVLAEVLDTSPATYYRYETGELSISLPDLVKVAHYLGYPLGYFAGEAPRSKSEELDVLQEQVGQLAPEERASVEKLWRAVLREYRRQDEDERGKGQGNGRAL